MILSHRVLLDAAALLLLTLGAAISRIITSGLFSSGISTDEYRYALIAQEWLRILGGRSAMSLSELVVHHPLVPVFAGITSALAGLDPLSAGRGLQVAFNVATVPLLYLLLRAAGVPWTGALGAGVALTVMPGFWEASATFLPDSQLAFFSTLVFLGLVLGLRGSRWGAWLVALGLGAGFLTKEHLPLVVLPAAVVLCSVALFLGALDRRALFRLGVAAGLGLTAAVVLGAFGVGIPRAIVLAVVGGTASPASVADGLPPMAPTLDESAGSSWISSLITAILNLQIGLEWFNDALGLRIVSGAVAVLGVVGAAGLVLSPGRPIPIGPLSLAVAAVPAALFIAQMMIFGAWDALAIALLLTGGCVLLWRGMKGSNAIIWPDVGALRPDATRFWSLLAGLAAYVAASIGFFALRLEQVSFLPRMFLPIMPALAVFAGLGCLVIGQAARPVLSRFSPSLLVLLVGTVCALTLPGGPLRKGAAVLAVGTLAFSLYRTRLSEPLSRAAILAMGVIVLAVNVGTPTFLTLSRARDFKGYPDDPYYRQVSGGIRVARFRAAEGWLQSNLKPGDTILTSKPYQVAWHSALGFGGFRQVRVWDERAADRRRYLSDELLQDGAYTWIVDFNQFAAQPQSPEGPAFDEDYHWLQSRPYLREAYAARDDQGRILLYVFRHEV